MHGVELLTVGVEANDLMALVNLCDAASQLPVFGVEAAKKRVQRALKQLKEMLSLSKDPAVYACGGEGAGGGSVSTEER